VETYGGLDVLVSNAGLYPRMDLPELTEEVWDLTVDVNLKGHYLCAKHGIPKMVARGGGSIIFIGSVHGYMGAADVLDKADGLTRIFTAVRDAVLGAILGGA